MMQSDPMAAFWRLLMPFLFKQSPVIIFMGCGLVYMDFQAERMRIESRADRMQIRQECANAIIEIRQELKICQDENDTIRAQNSVLISENIRLNRRISVLEKKLNIKK